MSISTVAAIGMTRDVIPSAATELRGSCGGRLPNICARCAAEIEQVALWAHEISLVRAARESTVPLSSVFQLVPRDLPPRCCDALSRAQILVNCPERSIYLNCDLASSTSPSSFLEYKNSLTVCYTLEYSESTSSDNARDGVLSQTHV